MKRCDSTLTFIWNYKRQKTRYKGYIYVAKSQALKQMCSRSFNAYGKIEKKSFQKFS